MFTCILHSACCRKDEVKQELKLCSTLWPATEKDQIALVDRIEEVFALKYRRYLSVFQLGRDTSLTNTIFRAVFDSKSSEEWCSKQSNDCDLIFSSG